jgi:PAS domain S-box-containing protein
MVMSNPDKARPNWKRFVVSIVSPAVLAIGLFIAAIFVWILPAFERAIMDRKKEMIHELTASAWSILAEMEARERNGSLTRAQAQQLALESIRDLRYGPESKDYFWINDLTPRMIMHPYREDLNGHDLTEYHDRSGKRLFVEFVEAVRANGEGFVEYQWQWKDDPNRIVPKLSYVRGFTPWGWIVGTGIYIEDVRSEVAALKRQLLTTAAIISGAIALLLAFLAHQSWLLEQRRSRAEAGLRESEERYRTLVEAATEGILMVLAGRQVYSNSTLRSMLGYDGGGFAEVDLRSLPAPGESGAAEFLAALAGEPAAAPFEARLRTRAGEWLHVQVTTSAISLSGQPGVVMTVKDISAHKEVAAELGKSRDKYRMLTENISVGVFRAAGPPQWGLVEGNPALLELLGLRSREELQRQELSRFFPPEEWAAFTEQLRAQGAVKGRVLHLRREDGQSRVLALSAALVTEPGAAGTWCDGLVEDVTEQQRQAEERERVLADLQASLLPLHTPLSQCVRPIATCDLSLSARRAAELMTRQGCSAVLVTGPAGEMLGIVTDQDVRTRLVAAGRDPQLAVSQIMSAPVVSMPTQALVFEAGLLMQEKGIQHIVVTDPKGAPAGLVSGRDLLGAQRHSGTVLIQQVRAAHAVDDAAAALKRMPLIIKALIDSGVEVTGVTRLMAGISDACVAKLIELALAELGPPPSAFAFMALGSEGRGEQTLATDQDNAIIFEDGSDGAAQEYFLKLGARVCAWLDQLGYAFCKGETMARSPKWCKPAAAWKEMFTEWTLAQKDQDLMDVNICFDFRCVYGDAALVRDLRRHVNGAVRDRAVFLFHLARTTLEFKPPVGLFGNIVVGADEEHPETFSIKSAIIPIVNFARVYALHHGLEDTGTLDRLRRLFEAGVLARGSHDELAQAYNALMQMRLRHQAAQLSAGQAPDNYVDPRRLTHLDRALLKRIFSHIAVFQARLAADFARTS